MFPREHGAWSMLLQPVLVAAILARQSNWTIAAALLGIVAVFLVRQPLIVLARQRYVWKDLHPETALAYRWLAGLGVVAALAGTVLAARWPVGLIAGMGLGAAFMTVLAVWATIRNRQRSVWLQVVSAVGLTSAAVAIEASACGSVLPWALWLWAALALQATAAILVVHARLDAKIHARKPKAPPLERPSAAFAVQGLLLVAAVTLASRQDWWLAAAMALPGLLNWFELVQISNQRTLDVPLTKVGFKAMGVSIAVNALLIVGLWPRAGCPVDVREAPRQSAHLTMRDVTFHSAALGRDMTYRAYVPQEPPRAVVYLLHGGGGGFRDWSNYSDIAALCDTDGWLLIMPEAGYSYYTNAAARPQDRFEDYITQDLLAEVEQRFHPADRRVVVGVSMGGYGAIKLALKHPDLFLFAAGLSPALDVPRRQFTLRRASQWRDHAAIFGPQDQRRDNDPFVLVKVADPLRAPPIYIWTGQQEGLLEPNRAFAALLEARRFRYEFHTTAGAHDWKDWNRVLPDCIQQLRTTLLTYAAMVQEHVCDGPDQDSGAAHSDSTGRST